VTRDADRKGRKGKEKRDRCRKFENAECRVQSADVQTECRKVQALSGTGDSIIYFVTAADFFVSASLGSFFC
jgi:hypothetical protein